jgi:DNA-binding transcriptional ArsR family regulator
MALADKVALIQADLAALSGAVTYRNLADQLKAAIAVSMTNGLAAVSVTLPTGTSLSYPTINVALLALQNIEAMAAEEDGGMATAKMRLA